MDNGSGAASALIESGSSGGPMFMIPISPCAKNKFVSSPIIVTKTAADELVGRSTGIRAIDSTVTIPLFSYVTLTFRSCGLILQVILTVGNPRKLVYSATAA